MPIDRPTYQLKFALDLPEEQAPAGLSTEDVAIISEAARKRLDGGDIWAAGGAVPTWYENYLRLIHTGWPWRVACYIAWLAMPKPREPKTQLGLALNVLGLGSDRQLSVWMGKNPAIPEMVQKLRHGLVFEELGEVIAAGLHVAQTHDYKGKGDRELIYKMTGMLGDSLEIKLPGGGTDLSKLSWDEKLALAGLDTPEAIERLREETRARQRQQEGVIDGQISHEVEEAYEADEADFFAKQHPLLTEGQADEPTGSDAG